MNARRRLVVRAFGGPTTRLQRVLSSGLVGCVVLTIAVPIGFGQRAVRPALRWDASLAPLVSFVEKERGRTFRSPVALIEQDPATFDAANTRGTDTSAFSADSAIVLSGAGITKPANRTPSADPTPPARYDASKTAVIVRSKLDPSTAPATIEALVDALQHQVFDLTGPTTTDAESQAAWQAVRIGDRARIRERYRRANALPGDAPSATDAPMSAYELLLETSKRFGDRWGAAMVEQTFAVGGTAAVDRLFVDPPSSRADVIRRAFGDPFDQPVSLRNRGVADVGALGWFAIVSRFDDFGAALGAARSVVGERTVVDRRLGCFAADLEVTVPAPWRSRIGAWTPSGPHQLGTVSTCRDGQFDFAVSDGLDAIRALNALPVLAADLAHRRNRPMAWALCVAADVAITTGPAALLGEVSVEPAASDTGRATCDDRLDGLVQAAPPAALIA